MAVHLVNVRTEDDNLPYIGLEHVESWTGRLVNWPGEEQPAGSTTMFAPGDILFGKLRPYLAKVVHATRTGRCSPELLVLRTRVHDPQYIHYYLLSDEFIRRVDATTYGSKMPRANWDDIGNLHVPIPAMADQRTIADFLDEKTAAIDALIAKKERLIELIEEKRQATITHAVTKGLDPDVPMKDSGVEWLGEVPAHWRTVRGRFLFRPLGGYAPAELDESQTEVNYYKVDDLNGPTGEWDLGEASVLVSRYGVRPIAEPVVLFPKRGAAIFTNKVRVTTRSCVFDTNVMGLKPSSNINAHFLAYSLWSRGLADVADVSTIPQINNKHINELVFGLPPLEEQLAIISWLNKYETNVAVLVASIVRHVTRLREYRQTLISAAVTGQLDVRSRTARALDPTAPEPLEEVLT